MGMTGQVGTLQVINSGLHAGEISFQFALQNYGKSPALTTTLAPHIAVGDEQIKHLNFSLRKQDAPPVVPPGINLGLLPIPM